MSEKLSKRMKRWGLPVQWPLDGWANEVAAIEAERDELRAKLEAWRRTVDSYVNGDGTDRDLECALENGPLTNSEIVAAYGSDLDAAQLEKEE